MLVPEKEEVVQEPIKLSRRDALYSPIQKEYLEEKVGLPVLSLETDNFDSRTCSAASMRTEVETFANMLKAKKASAMA